MKKYLLIVGISFVLSLGLIAQDKKTEKVEILTSAICETCKQAIEYELTFTKGIKFVELDVDSKVVTVEFKPEKISRDEIRKNISGIGYHADSVKRDPEAYANLPFCCRDGGHADDHQ